MTLLLFACAGAPDEPKPTDDTGTPAVETGDSGDPGETGDTGDGRGATPPTWYLDADGDGYGDPDRAVVRCDPPGLYVADGSDCDDTDPVVNPLGAESCNDADDDCDGEVDELGATGEVTLYPDADGDGWGVEGDATYTACSPRDGFGWLGDCDDADASRSPGSPELCDGLDQDCDDVADDDAGQASFDDGSGVLVDVTDEIGAGDRNDPITFGDYSTYDYVVTSGTLWLCDGTWYLKVLVTDADTHLVVRGKNGAEATLLTTEGAFGGASGSIVTVLDGVLEMEGVTLAGGAGSSGTNGGAVITNHSSGAPSVPNLTLTDSVVTANDTDYGGGIAIYAQSWVSLVDTRVEGNNATIAGGGVWMNSSGRLDCEATSVGSAGVVANTAPLGGGVYLSSSSGGNLDARGCDWGDDDDADDNEGYDVEQNPGGDGHGWCWTNASSITSEVSCASASCSASTDADCP
ncbi:MAG: putative metal-binding motif-containing protein [Myxococcota bacterium]